LWSGRKGRTVQPSDRSGSDGVQAGRHNLSASWINEEIDMFKRISAVLLSGGMLVGTGLPQSANAHAGPDEFVAFIAGTAVGYLLNADDDVHHAHHYHAYRPQGYVISDHGGWYAPPPVHVVHRYEHHYYGRPKHYKQRHHGGGRRHGRHHD